MLFRYVPWSSAHAADALHTCPKDPASRDFQRLVLRIAACMTVFSP